MAFDKNSEEAIPVQGELELDTPQEENPFLRGFRVPLKHRRTGLDKGNLALVDMSTGVIDGAAEVVRKELVDADQFLKVFRAQMGLFFGLSAPAVKVLTAAWIEAGATPGNDYITLSERIAAQHAKRAGHALSRATYFRGRKQLIEAGIIAPSTEPNRYWINPTVFFNGSRVRLITELVKGPEIAGPGEDFADENAG